MNGRETLATPTNDALFVRVGRCQPHIRGRESSQLRTAVPNGWSDQLQQPLGSQPLLRNARFPAKWITSELPVIRTEIAAERRDHLFSMTAPKGCQKPSHRLILSKENPHSPSRRLARTWLYPNERKSKEFGSLSAKCGSEMDRTPLLDNECPSPWMALCGLWLYI